MARNLLVESADPDRDYDYRYQPNLLEDRPVDHDSENDRYQPNLLVDDESER